MHMYFSLIYLSASLFFLMFISSIFHYSERNERKKIIKGWKFDRNEGQVGKSMIVKSN